MEEFDKIKWGFIFSLLAVAVGWFLNHLSQWWRVRIEDKRVLKEVLFNLLETHNIFLRFDMDKPLNIVTEKLVREIPNAENTEAGKTEIRKLLLHLAEPFMQKLLIDEIRNLETGYKFSIAALSKIDPLAAFYLSGKTSIIDKLNQMENWLESITQQYPEDFSISDAGKSKLMGTLKPNMIDEAIKDTEKQIISIAWKINPVVWWNTKKLMKEKKSSSNDYWKDRIDELFNELKVNLEIIN